MRLTVLGGSGAWPTATAGCSGYLVEQDGHRLLIDPGYATFPTLLRYADPAAIDAVLVSHGHPDHCADLNPLLRSRALRETTCPRLGLHAPPGALDPVLGLDRPGMLKEAYTLHERKAGDKVDIGPFSVEFSLLPHHVPNLGMRISAADRVLAYTGDTGPSRRLARLAAGAHVYLAEATHIEQVPAEDSGALSTAAQAGSDAAAAKAHRLLLTHLWPGTEGAQALRTATAQFAGSVALARPGLEVTV